MASSEKSCNQDNACHRRLRCQYHRNTCKALDHMNMRWARSLKSMQVVMQVLIS